MLEDSQYKSTEIWGGIECTINRVKDRFFDQLNYSQHYKRESDIELIADLGIKKIRYPVLWEKTSTTDFNCNRLELDRTKTQSFTQ